MKNLRPRKYHVESKTGSQESELIDGKAGVTPPYCVTRLWPRIEYNRAQLRLKGSSVHSTGEQRHPSATKSSKGEKVYPDSGSRKPRWPLLWLVMSPNSERLPSTLLLSWGRRESVYHDRLWQKPLKGRQIPFGSQFQRGSVHHTGKDGGVGLSVTERGTVATAHVIAEQKTD